VRLALLFAVATACGAPRPQLQQLPADAKLVDPSAMASGAVSSVFVAAERYKGRVVVLDFWAGWCAECKRTIPQVQRLSAAFASQGLLVVGVNAGEDGALAAKHARELGIEYPIALDPELELSDRLGGGKLPLLVVIDRDGTIVHRAKHVDEETLRVVRELLDRAKLVRP
jgi:thiol-disulfide isomerase/thioredoxin